MTRKPLAALRHEIAAVKRQVIELRKKLRETQKTAQVQAAGATPPEGAEVKTRFRRPTGADVRKLPQKLGLTQAQFGKLAGVSTLTIWKWERAKGRLVLRQRTIEAFRKPEEKHTGTRAVVEVGFHSLQHTFVSLCRESGAPLSVVEAIVGHASPAMTRHYTHTGEAAARASVAALPSVFGDVSTPAALPAPTGEKTATGTRGALPTWAIEAVGRALAALDAGDTATARRELAPLTDREGVNT